MGGFWYALVGRLIPSTSVGAVPRTRIMKRMSRTTLFATLVTTLSIVAVLVMPVVEAAPLRLQFQQTWGGPNSEIANGIAIGTDGNLYLAGQTNSFGAGGFDACLLKFSSSGTLTWQKTWGGRFDEGASGVAVAADGSVYMTGGTSSFTRNEAFLNKFNPDGTLVWQRGYGLAPSTLVSANALAIAQDGSIYITGDSQVQGTAQEIFLAKFAPDGTLVSQENWAETRLGSAGLGLAVSPDVSVWVTGNTGIGAVG